MPTKEEIKEAEAMVDWKLYGVTEPTGRGSIAAKNEEQYFAELKEKLNQQVASGAMFPEQAADYWDKIDTYVSSQGLTPALPYYRAIQEQVIERPAVEQYEKLKDFTLRSKLTFSEKLNKLLTMHPRAGDPSVNSQIRQDVLASLSPEERRYVDTGQMSPALNRQYKERWSLEPQGMSFEDWLSVKTGYLSAAEREPFMKATPSTPSYQPSFEATRAGLTGSQYWKNWFTNRFSDVLREYKTKGEPTEAGWSEFLAKRKAELKEEWWSLGAYGRGERPSSYQPLIKTVGF